MTAVARSVLVVLGFMQHALKDRDFRPQMSQPNEVSLFAANASVGNTYFSFSCVDGGSCFSDSTGSVGSPLFLHVP